MPVLRQRPLRRVLLLRLHLQRLLLHPPVERPVVRIPGRHDQRLYLLGLTVARTHVVERLTVRLVHLPVVQRDVMDVVAVGASVRQPAVGVARVARHVVLVLIGREKLPVQQRPEPPLRVPPGAPSPPVTPPQRTPCLCSHSCPQGPLVDPL